MLKIIGVIFLVAAVMIVVFMPRQSSIDDLWHKDKSELKEAETFGTISRYDSQIAEVQRILKNAGFNPGPIDGIMGGRTKEAIRRFQKAKGLKPTGKIDSVTQLALEREKRYS